MCDFIQLFLVAGSKQAASEAVDHLHGAEQPLQTAGGHQGEEQPDVELHHVLRLITLCPQRMVGQVGGITVENKMLK